ncbi:MAG: hypothetical protein JXR95_09780 [Deltaproteobacteria bacterium]|nr:hypothetical protein [Deltaproteobacteria bacterium]
MKKRYSAITGFVIFASTVLLLIVFEGCDDSPEISSCGNGTIDLGEDCDGDDLDNTSCASLGFNNAELKCNSDCMFDLSSCEAAGKCGDGFVDAEFEDCDGTSFNGVSCDDLGFETGNIGCTSECTFDLSGCSDCGDGEITGNEECDSGNMNENSCISLGYYGGELFCTTDTCRLDTSNCETWGKCGDGEIQINYYEQCDGDELNGITNCNSLDPVYYYENSYLTCKSDCTYKLADCKFCGDGIVQEEFEESCEPSNPDNFSCEASSFIAGTYVCNECVADFSDCNGFLFLDVSEGMEHSCGIDLNQQAWCWGDNNHSQLGNTLQHSSTPLMVNQPEGISFIKLSSGINHTCALDTAGHVWCWGSNTVYQLGSASRTLPEYADPGIVDLPDYIMAADISCGTEHCCIIDSSGSVWCWGNNDYGQLGVGSEENTLPPAKIETLIFTKVSAGGNHTCGLNQSGEILCWGWNNNGQLGNNDTADTNTPVTAINPGAVFVDISSNHGHSCAIGTNGRAYCWGWNAYGELGTADNTNYVVPTPVSLSSSILFSQIITGFNHSCALTSENGKIYCWGSDSLGQLGLNTTDSRNTPALSYTLGNIVFTQLGHSRWKNTCAIDSSRRLWCWGDNYKYQCGRLAPSTIDVPTYIHDPVF